MSALRPLSSTSVRARRLWVWLMVWALTCQSVSAAIIGVTGAPHRHVACEADEPAGEQGLGQQWLNRLIGEQALALIDAFHDRMRQTAQRHRRPAQPVVWTGGVPLFIDVEPSAAAHEVSAPACHAGHAHVHDGYERHVHDHGDASVRAVGEADHADGAGMLHAAWLLALPVPPATLRVRPAAVMACRWPVTQQAGREGLSPMPLERPPRT